jgi:hypothetical protein
VAAMGWSLLLGWKRLNREDLSQARRGFASACQLLAIGTVGCGWWLQFWGWA